MKKFKDLKVGNCFYAIHNEPYRIEEYKVASEPMMQSKFSDPDSKKFMAFTASCRGKQRDFCVVEANWDASTFYVLGYDPGECTTYYSDFMEFKARVSEKMDALRSTLCTLEGDLDSMIGWMYN